MFRTRYVYVYVNVNDDDDSNGWMDGWMISFWINDPMKTND